MDVRIFERQEKHVCRILSQVDSLISDRFPTKMQLYKATKKAKDRLLHSFNILDSMEIDFMEGTSIQSEDIKERMSKLQERLVNFYLKICEMEGKRHTVISYEEFKRKHVRKLKLGSMSKSKAKDDYYNLPELSEEVKDILSDEDTQFDVEKILKRVEYDEKSHKDVDKNRNGRKHVSSIRPMKYL